MCLLACMYTYVSKLGHRRKYIDMSLQCHKVIVCVSATTRVCTEAYQCSGVVFFYHGRSKKKKLDRSP